MKRKTDTASPGVILIICEGLSDVTALNILEWFTDELPGDPEMKPVIKIMETKGDKTTKQTFVDGVPQNHLYQECLDLISESIREKLTDWCIGEKGRLEDIERVFFVTDMDGVYISQNDIRPSDHYLDTDPYYGTDAIYTEGKTGRIASRNWRKRENLNWFLSQNREITLKVGSRHRTVPFSIFYMSCNLDHALSNVNNMKKEDKIDHASVWYDRMSSSGNTDDVRKAFHSLYPDAPWSYEGSWHYITKPCCSRSLERGSNCALILDYIENTIKRA